MSIWDSFTNQFSLSKTLRFELKPVSETRPLIDVIKKDKEIDRLYHKEMKPILDSLHNMFISESLDSVNFDEYYLGLLDKNLLKSKELNKNKRENYSEINNIEKQNQIIKNFLKKSITKTFEDTSKKWKDKYFNKSPKKVKFNNYEILTKECVLSILEQVYPQKAKIIKKFKRFFTYFTGFNQNRINYYTNKGKETEIGYRIIDENLVRFLNNRSIYYELREKIPTLKKYQGNFELQNYQNILTQEKIDNFNEQIIGLINSLTNKFSQNNKIRLPKLKILYKQIGADKAKKEIFEIKKGEEWKNLQELIYKQRPIANKVKKVFDSFFKNPNKHELNKIYFNKQSISTISNFWFSGGWQTLAQKLVETKTIRFDKKKDEYKLPNIISLLEIKEVFEIIDNQNADDLFKDAYKDKFKPTLWQTFLAIWQYEFGTNFKTDLKKKILKPSLNEAISKFNSRSKKQLNKNKKKDIEIIKNVCDAFLSIERMIKYHRVKEELEKDNEFYNVVDEYLNNTKLNKYYNAFRNYITQKPFDINKIKLNFENSTLGSGWDINKESVNLCVILKSDDNKFYLAIADKENNFVFDKDKNKKLYQAKRGKIIWQKMDYRQIANPAFDIHNLVITKNDVQRFTKTENKEKYWPKEIIAIKQKKSYAKENFNRKDFKTFIDYIKKCAIGYWPEFKFNFSNTASYKTISDFTSEIEKIGYKINFVNISKKELNKLVKDKKIFLFEIYNKDLSNKSKGIKNLHTLLFLELLKPKNSDKLKLLGGAEIFYREASKDKKMHKDSKGKKIIKSKRYYQDKYFLHFPIEIRGPKQVGNFNQRIQDLLSKKKTNIIGIDRGEKHLLYYSVIKPDGIITKQGSFNRIKTNTPVNNKKVVCKYDNKKELKSVRLVNTGQKVNYIDYLVLLDFYEKKRILARKSWQSIGKIKDLKEGYLSQVIYEIYKLIIRYDAIIVMENLSTEFKEKRTAKVEKSVYKKFELALARKLNHLIFKNRKTHQIGGVLNAYQLTPVIDRISTFEKTTQWGILFYVQPNYTSITDPLTGWRKHLYIPNSATINEIKESFKYINIEYDNSKKCYQFSYKDDYGKSWELFAYKELERFRFDNNKRKIEKYDLYKEFKLLFEQYDKAKNIKNQIENDKHFNWKNLIFYWNLLNQIRNTDRSRGGDENDFLQSPVWSKKYRCFYDSRKVNQQKLPGNGDANGAYNIARKGAILLKRLNNKKEIKEKGLFISKEDWDKFVTAQI